VQVVFTEPTLGSLKIDRGGTFNRRLKLVCGDDITETENGEG